MGDTDNGRQEYADEAYLDALRDGAETTQEVADAVGVTRQGADYRLRQLRDKGRVTARKVGGTLLWSPDDSGGDG